MVQVLYSIGLFLYSCFVFPKLLYLLIFHKKYRSSLLQRFGCRFPQINKGTRPLIWIHAVSVGETKAVAPLAKLLKNGTFNPIILISSTTETGHAEAIRALPFADYHVYMPFDFNWIIRSIVQTISPDLVILCESDFWLNFLTESKKSGAQVALVNGKISERSLNRFKAVPFFVSALFSKIDIFCIQNEYYKKRFEQLGIPTDKLQVTGNIKFDDPHTKLNFVELANFKQKLRIGEGELVIVVGSTHDPEEKMVLTLLPKFWEHFPNLKVIIVPRHPERFNEVDTLLANSNIKAIRFSKIVESTPSAQVILIDAMGLLRQCYQVADVAIVGGSFTSRVGGHNILEPGWYGVPVVYGPYMQAQPELVELSKQYGSGIQVEENQLINALLKLLQDPSEREKLGAAGKKLVQEAQGATQKTFDVLIKKMEFRLS